MPSRVCAISNRALRASAASVSGIVVSQFGLRDDPRIGAILEVATGELTIDANVAAVAEE